MAAPRTSRTLRTWYAVFLGIMVTLVLGLVSVVLVPEAPYDPETGGYGSATYGRIQLQRMLISLVSSVAVLAAGLFLARRAEVLASGLVLGALFNLVVGNSWGWDYDNDGIRLLVAVVSLVLTAVVGWWYFIRDGRRAAGTGGGDVAGPPAAGGEELVFGRPDPGAGQAATALPSAGLADLDRRLSLIERRLSAVAEAMSPDEDDDRTRLDD